MEDAEEDAEEEGGWRRQRRTFSPSSLRILLPKNWPKSKPASLFASIAAVGTTAERWTRRREAAARAGRRSAGGAWSAAPRLAAEADIADMAAGGVM